MATGLNAKHTIKQVDRLLSNTNLLMRDVFRTWVPFVIGKRLEVVVALDWTDFDADDHATIALHLITSHGRATPLMWKTHEKSTLAKHRNAYEDELLRQFREILPPSVRAILLADRGFGDQALYTALTDAHIDFVIRFRGNIHVTSATGETRTAAGWVPSNGKARKIVAARITHEKTPVAAVVCVKARRMKEPWCLATSLGDRAAAAIVKLYGRRFSIEIFQTWHPHRYSSNHADAIHLPDRQPRFGAARSARRRASSSWSAAMTQVRRASSSRRPFSQPFVSHEKSVTVGMSSSAARSERSHSLLETL
jgi:hypothetical protein